MPIGEKRPSVPGSAFVAPNASVIGQVSLGEKTIVFYGAVLRGDQASVQVGSNSVVGDRVVLSGVHGVTVGDHVQIGSASILQDCKVDSECIVGPGCILGEGAHVSAKSQILAGSIIADNQVVPSGELWGGVPAKKVRDLTESEISSLKTRVAQAVSLGAEHEAEHRKSEAQRQKDRDHKEFYLSDESRYKESPF